MNITKNSRGEDVKATPAKASAAETAIFKSIGKRPNVLTHKGASEVQEAMNKISNSVAAGIIKAVHEHADRGVQESANASVGTGAAVTEELQAHRDAELRRKKKIAADAEEKRRRELEEATAGKTVGSQFRKGR
jgi:hypothetical protein